MSPLRVLVFAVAALLIITYVSAGNCPPKNKVIVSNKHQSTCNSDADCQKYGQICCPNSLNTKSCTPGSNYMNRDDGRNKNKDKYNGGGRPDKYQPYKY